MRQAEQSAQQLAAGQVAARASSGGEGPPRLLLRGVDWEFKNYRTLPLEYDKLLNLCTMASYRWW